MKIALVVSGIVILAAVIYYLVQRQTDAAARATSGAGDIDPVTGQRWQTIEDARRQAAGTSSVIGTAGAIHS